MSKRTVFTTVTPIPANVPRQLVHDFLHDHSGLISLSPIVKEHHVLPSAPPHAAPDEYYCTWYSITDKISYLPGISGSVTYSVWFHDLPDGCQTRCYAPMGVNIKSRWTVGGNEPGEERKAQELGIKAPEEGLWLREDVDLKCGLGFTTFVKKKLKDSHEVLVARLCEKAKIHERHEYNKRIRESRAVSSGWGPPVYTADQKLAPNSYGSSSSHSHPSPPSSPPLSPPYHNVTSPYQSMYAEMPLNEVAALPKEQPAQEMPTNKTPVDNLPKPFPAQT